jgi:PST family polysaccharide transporter
MTDLKQRTIRALSWSLILKVGSQIISFSIGIVIARLLMPDDFGLLAMAMVFVGVSSLLSNVGLGSAIIQSQHLSKTDLSTIFWLNMVLASLMATLLYSSSEHISRLYQRIELVEIIETLSVVFLINATATVPRTLLMKDLEFKSIAKSDLIAMFSSGLVAITFAKYGLGYWSLVAQSVSSGVISCILIWLKSKWFPSLIFSFYSVKKIFRFSISVFLTQTLQFITRNIDKFLLGRYLGGEQLGIYDKAYSILMFPLTNISHVIGSVMFPSLSSIQNDKERVRSIYLKVTGVIALCSFPILGGLYVVSDFFVICIIGEHWAAAIPIIKILSIGGFITTITSVTGAIYLSQGAADLQLKVNLITRPIAIISVLIGLHWGIIGIALGFVISSYINGFITLFIASKLINLKLMSLVKKFQKSFINTLIMTIFLITIKLLYLEILNIKNMMLLISLGMLSYLVLSILSNNTSFKEVVDIIMKKGNVDIGQKNSN